MLVRLDSGQTVRRRDPAYGAVAVLVAPWEITLALGDSGGDGDSALNRIPVRVERVVVVGNRARVTLGGIVAEVTPSRSSGWRSVPAWMSRPSGRPRRRASSSVRPVERLVPLDRRERPAARVGAAIERLQRRREHQIPGDRGREQLERRDDRAVKGDRIGLRRASHEVIDQPVGGAPGHAI